MIYMFQFLIAYLRKCFFEHVIKGIHTNMFTATPYKTEKLGEFWRI